LFPGQSVWDLWWICWKLGQDFLRVLLFSPVTTVPPTPHTHSAIHCSAVVFPRHYHSTNAAYPQCNTLQCCCFPPSLPFHQRGHTYVNTQLRHHHQHATRGPKPPQQLISSRRHTKRDALRRSKQCERNFSTKCYRHTHSCRTGAVFSNKSQSVLIIRRPLTL
jgi:hypothetical protein